MSVYKVPQDVEAEDKLLGPFSFRQFIYLLIGAGAVALTIFFVQAPLPVPALSIITIPIAGGFIILALPLRKDQPMEIYLLAMVRFFLKPKRRIWLSDGSASGVVIDAPKVVQQQLTKDLSQNEALDRFSYLSRIVDSRGWAAKGVDIPNQTSVATAVMDEASDAEDVLDENASVSKSFDDLLTKQKQATRDEAVAKMRAAQQRTAATSSAIRTATAPQLQPTPTAATPAATSTQPAEETQPAPADPQLRFNPYPQMHQQVLQPYSDTPPQQQIQATPQVTIQSTTSTTQIQNNNAPTQANPAKSMTQQISPDIMRLANNNDLSVQAIANEAHRIKEDEGEEVVISLR